MPPHEYQSVHELCKKLIQFNIAVKPKEEVFLVCDRHTDMDVAYALADAIAEVGGVYTISIMPPCPPDWCNETTAVIAQSAQSSQVIISLTRYNSCALFDTRVNQLMRDKKLRDIALSSRDLKTFLQGGVLADYKEILAVRIALKKRWESKKRFHITSELGTNLTGELGDYPV